MAEIKTEHCVEIRVPLEDGDFGFGSGYTLAPHWVLTAYHVLFPDGVDDSQSIEITWWDESASTEKGVEPVVRDEIVWFSQEHDIALICCESPYKDVANAWDLIGKDKPKQWAECKCGGFLSNLHNEKGNQRRKTPSGKLGGFSSKENRVDIDNLSVSLKKDKYWEGFSGSPVFAGGKLAAVVRTVNVGEKGAGLVASIISPALDVEGGRDQVRLRDVPEFFVLPGNRLCWERFRSHVIKALDDDPVVYEAIKNDYLDKLENDADINNVSHLVDALYRTPEDKVIRCFLRVLKSMLRQNLTSGVEVMEYLARVWLSLLAADHGSIDGIGAFKNNPSAEPFAVNAVDPVPVDVESQAANGEDREPRLQLSGQRLRSPMDLTPEHKTGLDENDRQAARDAGDAYSLKTQPGLEAFKAGDVKDELEQFATRPVTGLPGPIAPKNDGKRGRLIADQLVWDYEELGGSVYIRIPRPDETGESSALRKLHEWCPQLLIFEVSKDDNPERINCLTGLHRIIHHAQKFLAGDINTQDGSS